MIISLSVFSALISPVLGLLFGNAGLHSRKEGLLCPLVRLQSQRTSLWNHQVNLQSHEV